MFLVSEPDEFSREGTFRNWYKMKPTLALNWITPRLRPWVVVSFFSWWIDITASQACVYVNLECITLDFFLHDVPKLNRNSWSASSSYVYYAIGIAIKLAFGHGPIYLLVQFNAPIIWRANVTKYIRTKNWKPVYLQWRIDVCWTDTQRRTLSTHFTSTLRVQSSKRLHYKNSWSLQVEPSLPNLK